MKYYEVKGPDEETIRIIGKSGLEVVLKQYYELQEPAKETIHIIGKNELEEVLLDTEVIGFDKDEECKLVRFNNHIFKYKVEFHDEFSIKEEKNNIIFFVDIDDASEIERISNEIEAYGISNFHIFVENKGNIAEDEEQTKIEILKANFKIISNRIELFKLANKIKFNKKSNKFEFEDEKNTYESFDNIFTHLTKGEEQLKEDEDGCCRV